MQYKKLAEHLSKISILSDLDALYTQMFQAVYDLFHVDKIAIFRCERHSDIGWCSESQNLSKPLIDWVLSEASKFSGLEAGNLNESIVIEETSSYFQDSPLRELIETEAISSIAGFPMLGSDDSLGGLVLFWEAGNNLSAEALEMGAILAKVAGATLQKINLINSSEIDLNREKQLNEIYQSLNNLSDIPSILLNVVRMSAQLIEADSGLLGVLIDSEMMTFYPYNIPSSIHLKPASRGRGVAWEIAETGQPIFTQEYYKLHNAQQKWVDLGISSFIGVPLQTANECFGVLTLFKLRPDSLFKERDLTTVEIIGQQAAIMIENLKMISEMNHRTNALATALNRQEELDKLKNQFIHTVSHELRSPLGIIFGHAELLENGALGELSNEQLESVQIMGRRVRMLNDLVDDLSALLAAETQEFRREMIDTNMFLTAVSTDHAFKAQSIGIRFETQFDSNLLWLKGDMTHLQRVFDNLFSNAFKFTPSGGLVCLRASNIDKSVEFELIDSGTGIDPEQLPRIFERFYQVHSSGKPIRSGTGLGLALVKEIVDAHRGFVTVESVLGEGTTFKISLPGFSPHTPPN